MQALPRLKPSQKAIHYGIIVGCTFLAMLICCAYTSPLYPHYCNSDSAIFMVIGKGMAEGKLCYADLFDHKGPILFFIEALGWLLGGRSGIWLIETVFVACCALIIYEICSLFKANPVLPLVASALIFFFTFGHGNLTEDYCLPYLYFSLYLCIRYYLSDKDTHPIFYAFFYGIAFAVIAFIRINNALIICLVVLAIVIDLIRKKQYVNLFCNFLSGLLGILVVTVPLLLYFQHLGTLKDMLFCTFTYNFHYSGTRSHLSYLSLDFFPLLAFLLPGLLAIFIFGQQYFRKKEPLSFALLLISLGNFAMLAYFNIYSHYFTLAIPLISIAAAFVVSGEKWKALLCVVKKEHQLKPVFACADWKILSLLSICLIYTGMCAYRTAAPIYKNFLTDISYDRYAQISSGARVIPAEEQNSVIGFEIPPEWYIDADITPCYKYYTMQSWWTSEILDVCGEFFTFVETEHPRWVITQSGCSNSNLTEILSESYTLMEHNDYADYYRYNGVMS